MNSRSAVDTQPVLWLARTAYDDMCREAAHRYPRETGGVLLGYADQADRELVVRVATGPGPGATHEPHCFVPDHAYHDAEVARVYEESHRQWSYLGDWHTHPDGLSTLSDTDQRTLSRIARSPQARAPRPLMLLLAGSVPGAAALRTQGSSARTERRARAAQAADGWQLTCWRMMAPSPKWQLWSNRGRVHTYWCCLFEP